MKKLEISINNCFGIGEFNCSFDLSKDNVIMIYAPNGTMKTSLARTFLCLENNHGAADLIDNTKQSSYSFKLDGESLTHDQIYVYKTEDNQIEPNGIYHLEEDNILSFNSSPNEVSQFQEKLKPIDKLLNQINQEFNKLIKYKNIVFYEETLKVFKHDGILCKYDSVYDAIIHAKNFYVPNCNFKGISYKELFDEYGVSAKYIRNYYEELVGVKKNNRKNIKVGNKKRWDRLCAIVDSNQYIREKIGDLELLRRDYLLSFINNEMGLFSNFFKLYNERKKELDGIIKKVKKDSQLWNQVIYTFNCRFHVPYELRLENRAETILYKETPNLKYTHVNYAGQKEYKSKEHFLNFISTGEKRAYYLLVNLFEIEKRKNSKEKQIIVIDDIAESFDYRNKYAIVEYLAELKECKNLILVILTHNFDFYRTIHSRLDVLNIYIANRNKEGHILLQEGKYVRDIIKNVLIKNIESPKCLIALIPFARNIVEYTKGEESYEYLSLTDYLHYNKKTKLLTLKALTKMLSENLHLTEKVTKYNVDKYIDSLFDEADKAFCSDEVIAIENKLILSMAIRMKAEIFMTNELIERIKLDYNINRNQTRFLYDNYRKEFPMKSLQHEVIKKVLMMTSENIHINNFMFEPIIDLSLDYLKDLYNEVRKLE